MILQWLLDKLSHFTVSDTRDEIGDYETIQTKICDQCRQDSFSMVKEQRKD